MLEGGLVVEVTLCIVRLRGKAEIRVVVRVAVTIVALTKHEAA